MKLLDKSGREIENGDLLRTVHFRGPRKKVFYLYHVATERDGHRYATPTSWLHPQAKRTGGEALLKYQAEHMEIIDGYENGWWYDRKQHKQQEAQQ